MGNLGYGYGSEFHLLRWLGRHRTNLNKRLFQNFMYTKIEWFDFNFKSMKFIPDDELKGIEPLQIFLDKDSFNSIQKKWSEFWPKQGQQQNWDAAASCIF